MERGRVKRPVADQIAHRPFRKWRQRDPARGGERGEIAEHESQRMAQTDLVIAIGQDHHRRDTLHTAAQEFEYIERGLVRPMYILEDHDRWALLKIVQKRAKEDGAVGLRSQLGEQVALHLRGDIVQGTQRAGSEQRIARAPQHTG